MKNKKDNDVGIKLKHGTELVSGRKKEINLEGKDEGWRPVAGWSWTLELTGTLAGGWLDAFYLSSGWSLRIGFSGYGTHVPE